MNCPEARDLINAYADGELDLVNTLEIEKHIRDCTPCAAVHRNLIALRASVREGSLYFRAPPTLERQIRSQLRRARSEAAGNWTGANWGIAAAIATALILASIWAVLGSRGSASEGLLVAEVTSAHVRSLMAEHLWDVKSSDQHTVKPWFDGKLDFAPDVHDFKAGSFALEGGRLDYLANRPVAALVYRHEKHYINLFIWPTAGRVDEGETVTTRQGYVLVHWIHAGMNYWVVSDMSEEAVRRFSRLVRDGGSQATKPVQLPPSASR